MVTNRTNNIVNGCSFIKLNKGKLENWKIGKLENCAEGTPLAEYWNIGFPSLNYSTILRRSLRRSPMDLRTTIPKPHHSNKNTLLIKITVEPIK
jgi:hypothetical protein